MVRLAFDCVAVQAVTIDDRMSDAPQWRVARSRCLVRKPTRLPHGML
jgi:hypothetical protein